MRRFLTMPEIKIDRSLSYLEKGLIPKEKGKQLLDFCLNSEVDIKRQDAVLVLETVKKLIEEA